MTFVIVDIRDETCSRFRFQPPRGEGSTFKEGQGFRDEIGVVLEDSAMAGVCVDHQLCSGDSPGEIVGIAARHHPVLIAIRNQSGNADGGQVLRRLQPVGLDRPELRAERAQRYRLVPVRLALFQPFQKCLGGAAAIGVVVKKR